MHGLWQILFTGGGRHNINGFTFWGKNSSKLFMPHIADDLPICTYSLSVSQAMQIDEIFLKVEILLAGDKTILFLLRKKPV